MLTGSKYPKKIDLILKKTSLTPTLREISVCASIVLSSLLTIVLCCALYHKLGSSAWLRCVMLDALILHLELAVPIKGVLTYNCVLSVDKPRSQY